jgi:hypothetical protein
MPTNSVTTGPTLSELLTLMPEADIPDDARLAVTAGDLRAMLSRLKVASDAIQVREGAFSPILVAVRGDREALLPIDTARVLFGDEAVDALVSR